MNAFWRKSLGITMLFSSAYDAQCQLDLSKYEIGLSGGVFVYQGDLTPNPIGSYRTLRPTFNLFVNKVINPYYSVRASFYRGGLAGSDAAYNNPYWRKLRAFGFNSRVSELTGLLIYNPLGSDRKWYPYLFGGLGLSFVKIQRDWTGFNAAAFVGEDLSKRLEEDVAHPLPRVIPVTPVGAGIRYSLSQHFSLMAETSYRLTRTDYLDGFSKAANPQLYDHYQSHTIGIIYSFGKKSSLDCPVIVQ